MIKKLLVGIFIVLAAMNSIAQSLNSDVTQANIKQTICVSGWTATIRPPTSYTSRVKRKMLSAGMVINIYPKTAKMSDYVLDHPVPLGAGGAPKDPKNLILQTVADGVAKDRIEALVRRRICSGRITLAYGQAVFMENRWSFYK